MNRYSDIKKEKLGSDDIRKEGILIYSKNVIYPEIPYHKDDIYILTDSSDNLPELSYKFYNDSTLYWVILIANPDELNFGSIYPPIGSQIRIPINISGILDSFNKLNSL